MHFTSVAYLIVLLAVDVHSYSSQLKMDLLVNYDPTIRPVLNEKNKTTVIVQLLLKFYQLDIYTNVLTIDSWLSVRWQDAHLKWDPANYNNIKSLHFLHQEIWMPDISVYNRNDQSGNPLAFSEGSCIVSHKGLVVCVPPSHLETICVSDLTKYPYDVQNCTVRIGSWVHTGEQLDLRTGIPPMSIEDVAQNPEWKLANVTAYKHDGRYKCCPNDTFPSIFYIFGLERRAGAHAASVVLPAIALAILTLITLLLPANDHTRMNICLVDLICHFLYTQYVSLMVPLNGHNTPLLILLGRDSTLLCVFTLLLTVVLRNWGQTTKPAPIYVSNIVSFASTFRPIQWILLRDFTTGTIKASKLEEDGSEILNSETQSDNKEWLKFSKILDRICFISYLIVYLSFLIRFF